MKEEGIPHPFSLSLGAGHEAKARACHARALPPSYTLCPPCPQAFLERRLPVSGEGQLLVHLGHVAPSSTLPGVGLPEVILSSFSGLRGSEWLSKGAWCGLSCFL